MPRENFTVTFLNRLINAMLLLVQLNQLSYKVGFLQVKTGEKLEEPLGFQASVTEAEVRVTVIS